MTEVRRLALPQHYTEPVFQGFRELEESLLNPFSFDRFWLFIVPYMMLYDIFLVINNRKLLSGCNCTLDLSCNFVQETCSVWIYWGNSKVWSSFSVPVASSIRLGYNLEQCSSLHPDKITTITDELEWDCFVISFGRSNCFAGSLLSKLLLVNDFPFMSEMRIFHRPLFWVNSKTDLIWLRSTNSDDVSFKIRFFRIWRTSSLKHLF